MIFSDKNLNILKKKVNSENEYEFFNKNLKEEQAKISEVLDKTRESKMRINSERNDVFKNLQKKDFIRSSDKSVDGMIKKNMEIDSNQSKEIDIKKKRNINFLWSERCNIY